MKSKAVPGTERRGPGLHLEPSDNLSIIAPQVAAAAVVTAHEIAPRALRPPPRLAPRGPDAVVSEFLEAFRILVRSSRLYQRNHPRWSESLNACEHRLRDALAVTPSVQIRIERDSLTVSHGDATTPHGLPVPDPRGELKGLADEFTRCGVTSLEFLQTVHLGELDLLSQQIVWATRKRPVSAENGADMWRQWVRDAHVTGIRINIPAGRRDEAVLATLVAALMGYGDNATGPINAEESATSPASCEQTVAALALVERLAALGTQRAASTEEAARSAHAVLGESERGVVALLARASSSAPTELARDASTPGRRSAAVGDQDSLPSFLNRAADRLILDFARRSLSEGHLHPAEISTVLADLARVPGARSGVWAPLGSDEGRVAALVERFWDGLSARDKQRVLHSADAWCIPPVILARLLDSTLNAPRGERTDSAADEARDMLLAYIVCLGSAEPRARRAVAAGLGELDSQIARVWPHADAEDFAPRIVRAMSREESPEISGLLAALTERLAKRALQGRHYAEFDRILFALEDAAHDPKRSHFAALVRGITADDAWFYLVEDALANRALDPVLPRLLRREPARLLDRLALLLTASDGAELVTPMVRLVRAAGEPVLAMLAARLHERHRQPALAAIKLLAAADPMRLIAALPRALPAWDWNLQDLAVSELSRVHEPALASRVSRAFFECIEEAHHLVVPAMLDAIGLANDTSAIPMLLQIAGGSHSTLRDIFFRIKAVEALGRMRVTEAADSLRSIARTRNGLSYAEPAGLRSAADEALALLENHPSAARVRARTEALEKSARPFSHPRRYQRIPLTSSFSARLAGSHSGAARVQTIGLGGAFVQSEQRMSVGDSLKVEIRTGLRSIQSTAVVRNVSPDGSGIEFVHMKAEDRETLRRVIGRLTR